MTTVISPSEDDLKSALLALKTKNPSLGIPKIHTLLLSTHPEWTVSEKRTRKVLQNGGLVLNANGNAAGAVPEETFPSSSLVEGLDVAKWTTKVEVKYFGKAKGKGLVAREFIREGEIIWKEDPFILAPEWGFYDLQMSSYACGHCSTPLTTSPLTVPCTASTSSTPCPLRFCNRLCLVRSARTHPLLCASRNPASATLLHFARREEWMTLHALAQCTARILSTYQQDEQAFKEDWDFVRALAHLGMEERAKNIGGSETESDRLLWKKAHKYYLQAFQEPTNEAEKKQLAKLLKKDLPKEVSDTLFEYEAFSRGLGGMNLSLEAHGGLYVLHSHMNHSCTPNVSVRHFDQRKALSRITLVAKRDIAPGEELFITYVNPELPLERRRQNLLEWGFGKCMCERCMKEERELQGKGEEAGPSSGTDVNKADLEAELKAGLGVM